MKQTAHAALAEARRSVWCLQPLFWDSFSRLLLSDDLPRVEMPEAAPRKRSAARQETRRSVAVLPLHGLIMPRPSILSMIFGGSGGLMVFRERLAELAADDSIDAIVLDVDSPGGSTALVEETAADIRAAREAKPVIAVANTDAGSAAYWLASQASELVVTPSGAVGSIGAFILHVDYSKQNEMIGVDPTYISAGRFKVEGNPDSPLDDEAEAHLQAVVDEFYGTFVRDVAAGRGIPEKTVRRGFGEGRMMTAANAEAEGMVDRVATLEEVVGGLLTAPRKNPSARGGKLSRTDEARPDEELSPVKSPAQVARAQDEAMVDSIIASH